MQIAASDSTDRSGICSFFVSHSRVAWRGQREHVAATSVILQIKLQRNWHVQLLYTSFPQKLLDSGMEKLFYRRVAIDGGEAAHVAQT
jgi:hypothetical protein